MNLLQAYSLLNMITEDADNYLEEYKKYIINHKANVSKFADWLLKKCPEVFKDIDIMSFKTLINNHDESKFSKEEFEPYARFWFNDSEHYDYDPEYEAAWEHHWKNNKHHPEFWQGQDMPLIYILEMLCDWGSFSISKNDMNELFDCYYEEAQDDDEKNLSENTKILIEKILGQISAALEGEGT